ncbi:MAG: hypothetical protein AAFY84_11150 [Pseudomonadota bacterium]
MRCINIFLASLLFTLFQVHSFNAAYAEESTFPLAKEFAECTGVYKAVSHILDVTGDPETALLYNNVGNGSKAVARFFATGILRTELIDEFLKERSGIGYNRLLVAAKGGYDQSVVDECEELSDLRGEIVDLLLEQVYTTQNADNKVHE